MVHRLTVQEQQRRSARLYSEGGRNRWKRKAEAKAEAEAAKRRVREAAKRRARGVAQARADQRAWLVKLAKQPELADSAASSTRERSRSYSNAPRKWRNAPRSRRGGGESGAPVEDSLRVDPGDEFPLGAVTLPTTLRSVGMSAPTRRCRIDGSGLVTTQRVWRVMTATNSYQKTERLAA